MTDNDMEDLTIDGLTADLVKVIAALKEDVRNLERQRAVCLATRSLDSCFYAESIFEETLDETVATQIENLYRESLAILPSDSQSSQSVQLRLNEFLLWTDEFRSGKHLEITV